MAARLENILEPGGIAISRTVHDQIRGNNIAGPVAVYALGAGSVRKLDAETACKPAGREISRVYYVAAAAMAAVFIALMWFTCTHLAAQSLVRGTTIQGATVAVLPFDIRPATRLRSASLMASANS